MPTEQIDAPCHLLFTFYTKTILPVLAVGLVWFGIGLVRLSCEPVQSIMQLVVLTVEEGKQGEASQAI